MLFFSNLASPIRIDRVSLDGSGRISIVSQSISRPVDLAVDEGEDAIFWADAEMGNVERCDIDGANR